VRSPREVSRLYDKGMDVESTRHISLFAVAPIPLLVFLGGCLSNKIHVDSISVTEQVVVRGCGKLAVIRCDMPFGSCKPGPEATRLRSCSR
jgi:hypothetical protein